MINLKALRQKSGLSQLQLSHLTCAKPSDIASWECGTALPPLDKIITLCRALGAQVPALLAPLSPFQGEAWVPLFYLFDPQTIDFEPLSLCCDPSKGWFAIKIETDSLSPRINSGDLGFFCLSEGVKIGEIALLRTKADSLTIGVYSPSFQGDILAKLCEVRVKM
ncbi:MAG: helix-turn-helix domain-containing protein [Oscillospiraceae bacterium]